MEKLQYGYPLSEAQDSARRTLSQEQGLVLSNRQFLKALSEAVDFTPSVQDYLERGRDRKAERKLENVRKNVQWVWRFREGGGSIHHWPCFSKIPGFKMLCCEYEMHTNA